MDHRPADRQVDQFDLMVAAANPDDCMFGGQPVTVAPALVAAAAFGA